MFFNLNVFRPCFSPFLGACTQEWRNNPFNPLIFVPGCMLPAMLRSHNSWVHAPGNAAANFFFFNVNVFRHSWVHAPGNAPQPKIPGCMLPAMLRSQKKIPGSPCTKIPGCMLPAMLRNQNNFFNFPGCMLPAMLRSQKKK